MAIGGPRLDRPSAVGDEGRPRAASVTIAALVVVGLAVVTLGLLGAIGELTLLGLGVMLIVGGMALLSREAFGQQVVGHLLYHPGAALVVYATITRLTSNEGLIAAGVFLALLGVGATWSNVLVRDELYEASAAAPISYVGMLGWLVSLIVALWIASVAVTAAGDLAATNKPVSALFGVLGLVAAAGFLVRTALGALPIAELTPRPERAARRAALARYRRVSTGVAGVALALLVIAAIYGGQGGLGRTVRADPEFAALLAGLSSPIVVWPLVVLCGICAVATCLGLLAAAVADRVDAGEYDVLAGAVAGLPLVLIPLVSFVNPFLAALMLVAPLLTIVAGFFAVAAMDAGFVPERAAGPALGAVGLVVAAIGVALAGMPAPLAFACVAGAVIVWDCSTFGLGVTVELGHRPETRRLELYHGVLSVGVGIATVAAVTGLDLARRTVAADVGAWPAVGFAVLGAVLLAIAVHRREA